VVFFLPLEKSVDAVQHHGIIRHFWTLALDVLLHLFVDGCTNLGGMVSFPVSFPTGAVQNLIVIELL